MGRSGGSSRPLRAPSADCARGPLQPPLRPHRDGGQVEGPHPAPPLPPIAHCLAPFRLANPTGMLPPEIPQDSPWGPLFCAPVQDGRGRQEQNRASGKEGEFPQSGTAGATHALILAQAVRDRELGLFWKKGEGGCLGGVAGGPCGVGSSTTRASSPLPWCPVPVASNSHLPPTPAPTLTPFMPSHDAPHPVLSPHSIPSQCSQTPVQSRTHRRRPLFPSRFYSHPPNSSRVPHKMPFDRPFPDTNPRSDKSPSEVLLGLN